MRTKYFNSCNGSSSQNEYRTGFKAPRRPRSGPSGVIGGGRGPTGGDIAPASYCQHCGQPRSDHGQSIQDIDGRYEGGNHKLVVELRVDFGVCGVVSGDLFGTSFSQHDYLASFRTAPGIWVQLSDEQPWPVVFETRESKTALGEMTLTEGSSPGVVTLSLWINAQLPGLPARQEFDLTAEWQSPMLRRLSVEIEQETGTKPPPVFKHNDRHVTFVSAFADAGVEIFEGGGNSTIPKNDDKWGSTQLHALMKKMASADLTQAAWNQQLLWLGKPTRPGLLGVMFDTSAQLPRQGTAVFDTEIRDRVPNMTNRKVIQTAVHELGHSLNLAHRFEREVGRADSTSFMNYPWRFKGGNRTREFWDKFNFSFDPDELEFLRHAPRKQIIPGGSAFHSVSYWADGSGGYSPYLPEAPLDIVRLDISPPLRGSEFAFGQPVFLGVKLTNLGLAPLNLDRRLLDPKGNFLQISVRRLRNGQSGTGNIEHFHPIVERCMELDPSAFDLVPTGKSVENNIQINFGSGGFSFAEPGHYEVQVFGSVFVDTKDGNPSNDRELIVASNTLRIYVQHPKNTAEEIEVATVLQREDVGTYFALGGSAVLSNVTNRLAEVVERRMRDGEGEMDPIAASILRCQGIDMGRKYPPASLGEK
jgi:hypothetical protein